MTKQLSVISGQLSASAEARKEAADALLTKLANHIPPEYMRCDESGLVAGMLVASSDYRGWKVSEQQLSRLRAIAETYLPDERPEEKLRRELKATGVMVLLAIAAAMAIVLAAGLELLK